MVQRKEEGMKIKDGEGSPTGFLLVVFLVVESGLLWLSNWVYEKYFIPRDVPNNVHVEYWFLPQVFWVTSNLLVWGIAYLAWRVYVKRTK
jgi:hypothetical protein